MEAMQGALIIPRGVAVSVQCVFSFDKPKSAKKATTKTTKPDVDKLARSILDALTGICFEDDSQVISLLVQKAFGSPARAEITVNSLAE